MFASLLPLLEKVPIAIAKTDEGFASAETAPHPCRMSLRSFDTLSGEKGSFTY
jgi:hypothetical protein